MPSIFIFLESKGKPLEKNTTNKVFQNLHTDNTFISSNKPLIINTMEVKNFKIVMLASIVFFSCEKGDSGSRCISCEVEGVEICTDGMGQISLIVEGETIETGELAEDISFEEAANTVCESISVSSACAICDGPNVNEFEVCSTDEGVTIDGQLLSNTQGVSLDSAIDVFISNPNNDIEFEGLSCQRN